MKFRLVLKYLLAILIITVPLYPKFPLISVPGTFVSIRLEDFLIALAVIIFIVVYGKDLLSQKVVKNRFIKYLILYIAASFISVISAVYLTQTVQLHIGMLHLFRRVEYISLGLVIYYYLKEYPDDRRFFLGLIFPIIIYAFIYGFGQKNFSWPIIITQNQEYSKGVALKWVPGSHINSTFAGHYDLATYLVLFVPLVVSLFYYEKNIRSKLFYLSVFLASMWLLVNSASRISLASYLLASSLALIFQKKFKEIIPLVIVTIIFVIFSSNLLTRYNRIFQVARDIISTEIVPNVRASEESIRRIVAQPTPTLVPVFEDRSTSIRLNVEWPRAARAFLKNPFLGTGFSSITLATDNDYLRSLGETGLLGFLTFMLVILEVLRSFYEYIKTRSKNDLEFIVIASLLGGFVGVLINAVFIDIFEASKMAISLWISIGIGLSITTTKYLQGGHK